MELVQITYDNYKKLQLKTDDDPVRPELDLNFRLTAGRQIWALVLDGEYKAAICVAYCNSVPTTVYELDLYSQAAHQEAGHGSIAVAYTVWSKKLGAGQKIVLDIIKKLKKQNNVKRLVTLSPKTAMARKFHLRNGAFILQENIETDNYEYNI
jgi:hypothetical protein